MFVKHSKSNYFLLQFQTKYLTNQQKRIPIDTSLVPLASSTLPENIINSGSYALISALFDKEKNKYKRWIERPLKYTFDYSMTMFLNQYFSLIFDSIHSKKSLKKTLSYNILTSTSSAIIPSFKSSSNEIIWNIIGQIGTNTFLAIVNYFL